MLNKWSHSFANEGKGDLSEPGVRGTERGGTEMKTKDRAEVRDSEKVEVTPGEPRGTGFGSSSLPYGKRGKRHGDRWPALCRQQVSRGQGPFSHLLVSVAFAACSSFSVQVGSGMG